MKRVLFLLASITCLTIACFTNVPFTLSDELDDVTKQINDLAHQLDQSVKATTPLESELSSMKAQIQGIKNTLIQVTQDVADKKVKIDNGYKNLAQKQQLLNQTIRSFYIKQSYTSPITLLFTANSASTANNIYAYQKAAADQDKAIITNIALTVADLETQKKNLEKEEKQLIVLQASLDEQSAKLDGVISGAKKYQATLSQQIAQLSAKQQQLVAAKYASLNIPQTAYTMQGGCSSDLTNGKDPGFSPRFALFTYGVPNRVGMNQYGAWGRAKAGQNADTILHAYYNFDGYQNFDTNTTINVNDSNGFNSGNIIWSGGLDDYVKRVYEVPDSWTDNDLAALKAQAIAARSYVLATTNNGSMSICANQNCQVFKTDPKGGNWESAVNQTAGQAMMQGGQAVKAWFSSTHGGYVYTSGEIGWENKPWTKHATDASNSVNSFSDLQNNAYDKDSPWFYCDWGARSQYGNTAWLKSEELADIVNSILLVQADNSADSHILPTDKNDPNMWNESKVKDELRKHRTPFNSISSGHVDADFSSGKTTMVHFSGDGGSVDFPSDVFRKYFNLRSPANLNIVGPLYNVEQK